MRTVRHLLASKPSSTVHVVRADVPVIEALQLMAEHGIGAVLVMDGAELRGILSERDYARKIALEGKSSRNTPVADIMTDKVFSVTSADSVDHCMQMMIEHRIRHLPVQDDGAVVGVVSIGDLVKAVIDQQREELDHLQRYITS